MPTRRTFIRNSALVVAAASLYKRYGFILTKEFPSDAFGKRVIEQPYDLLLNK